MAAVMVLALAGVPNLATGGTLDWNLDLETGAAWRTMTSDELEAVGWAGHTGWMTRDYGGLDDFANGTTAEVHVAYNDTVHTLSFEPTDTVSKLLAKLLVVPVVAFDDVPIPDVDDTMYNETFHVYDGTRNWTASYAVAGEQFAGSTAADGHEIWLYPEHSNLTLDSGDEYVYAIKTDCDGSAGDGSGGQLDGPAPGGLCAKIDVPDAPEPNSIPFSMFLFGEVEWCESDRYRNDWAATLREHFGTVEEAHEDTPTYVEPVLTGVGCTTVAEGWTWDHNRKDRVHAHDKDENGNWHPWAFNAVQNEGAVHHGTDPGDDPDHSYLSSKVTLPCAWGDECDYGHVYDDTRGPRAWMRHLADYHADDHGEVAADTAVVYHLARTAGAAGWGANPGQHSVVSGTSRLISTHETGHNLGGEHCDAVDTGGGWYTVMVNADDCADYSDEDVAGWVNWFSDANRDAINACVDVDPGADPCYR